MTFTLVLRLAGPMQSWGDSSRYRMRTTRPVPTKSGVLGMLAAAEGRRRGDPLAGLAELYFAVRVDQPGTLLSDYQTAQHWQRKRKPEETKLVTRFYLSDAVFVAAIESPHREVVDGLAGALNRPRFPLFLGRRSCPAPPNLVVGVFEGDAVSVLTDLDRVPWQASKAHKQERDTTAHLPIHRDALPGERGNTRHDLAISFAQDVPVSFAQEHRRYDWREVVHEPDAVTAPNPEGKNQDPFFEAVASA